MESSKTLDILKQAILLEKRGKAFYSTVAEQSKVVDVKKIFEMMADEEDEHIKYLSEQFKNFKNNNKFLANELPKIDEDTSAENILTGRIKQQISAASFEAAAIASAIDFETRAVEVYSERAKNAVDLEEKKFYTWLADWERGHHKLLYELDKELKEKVWNDNSFWPF
jgi:rubrerythrin